MRGADKALGLVIQLVIDCQIKITAAGERATVVIQALCLGIQGCRTDHASDVVQRLGDAQSQALTAQHPAVIVVEVLRRKGKGLAAGDLTAPVVHAAEVFQQQRTGRVDQAVLVVELAVVHVQAQRGVAEQLAALLIKTGNRGGQRVLTADAPTVLVSDLGSLEIQCGAAVETPILTVVEGAGGDTHCAFAADIALLAVIQRRTGEQQRVVGDQFAAQVVETSLAVHSEVASAGQAAAGVGQVGHVDTQRTFAAELALIVDQVAAQGHALILLADQITAAVVQGAAIEPQLGLGTEQALATVEQCVHGQLQRLSGENLAAIAVVEVLAEQRNVAVTRQLTATVVEMIDVDFQRFSCAHQTGLAIVEAGRL
ncbi:hypothetical protein BN844_1285 [Pseudomonas sp. SHC52]|nr:hypothetical protein BN844_1285 [Pseudomonas sp. SHC52]